MYRPEIGQIVRHSRDGDIGTVVELRSFGPLTVVVTARTQQGWHRFYSHRPLARWLEEFSPLPAAEASARESTSAKIIPFRVSAREASPAGDPQNGS